MHWTDSKDTFMHLSNNNEKSLIDDKMVMILLDFALYLQFQSAILVCLNKMQINCISISIPLC